MLLAITEVPKMPRPPSGKPRKVHYRRAPAWCEAMTELCLESARIIKMRHLFFPRQTTWGDGVNVTGIVQGVLLMAADQKATITSAQWSRYAEGYARMEFVKGQLKGLHFDDASLDAFHTIGRTLETQTLPDDISLKWNSEYHYPLVIAVALQWFVEAYKLS